MLSLQMFMHHQYLAHGKTKNGDGVQTTTVAQQFHQGSLQFTNNSLDLAITGEGYFAMSPDLALKI